MIIIKQLVRLCTLSLCLLCFTMSFAQDMIVSGEEDEISRYTSNLPFEIGEIKIPTFPAKEFNITDYGAVGDGHTKNTEAFKRAIQACSEAEGGRVIVPEGIWLTGPIGLQSNVNLHLQKGAFVLFSPDINDYPLIKTNWEGRPEVRCTSPIYGNDLENIAITGQGIIDGSGHVWRPVKKFKMTANQWKELVESGGVVDEKSNIWWPSEGAMKGSEIVAGLNAEDAKPEAYKAAKEYLRPVLLSLVRCKNVLLDGPTFQNSPAWNLHPLMCENLVVRNVTVRNPWYSQNGDGIDIESCKNALIYNCNFDVGDDAICIKSGRDKHGRERGMPSENIVIADCIVYHGHGGFTIGSEMSGGVRNVLVRDCTFIGTDVGLRFKSTRGRGGIVENIYISDIYMKDIPAEAIRFNMFYNGSAPLPEGDTDREELTEIPVPPVSEETPRFQKIYMNNIICRGAERAVLLQGLPEMAIREIEMEDVLITAKNGLLAADADQIKLTDVNIVPENGPAFHFYNSKNVTLTDPVFPENTDIVMKVQGRKTQNIKIDSDANKISQKIELGKNVPADALLYN